MNEVTIDLSKYEYLTALAGNMFGREICNEQVMNNIDLSKPFYIKFPDNIRVVAIGFVQGFITPIIKEIGLDKLKENLNIVSINDEFVSQFMSKI